MKSIIQSEKECFACGIQYGLHLHHCFFGNPNRKLSDKYGLTVWLCPRHHNMSSEGVHFNKPFDDYLKQLAQRRFEAVHGDRKTFMAVFGRNYLEEE